MGKAAIISQPSETPRIPIDTEGFLQWCALHAEEGARYELSRGRVSQMMINVTRSHARICNNLVFTLNNKLDRQLFDISTADFGVKTKQGVRFPDVLVEPFSDDGSALASDQPVVIVEVLSPSTMSLDFGDKACEYKQIDSLSHYLLCDQDKAMAWLFSKAEQENWDEPATLIEGLDATILLPGLDIELAMQDIYRGITGHNPAKES